MDCSIIEFCHLCLISTLLLSSSHMTLQWGEEMVPQREAKIQLQERNWTLD